MKKLMWFGLAILSLVVIVSGTIILSMVFYYTSIADKEYDFTTPVNCTVISEFDCYHPFVPYVRSINWLSSSSPLSLRHVEVGGDYCYSYVIIYPLNETRLSGPTEQLPSMKDVHTCYLKDVNPSDHQVSIYYADVGFNRAVVLVSLICGVGITLASIALVFVFRNGRKLYFKSNSNEEETLITQ